MDVAEVWAEDLPSVYGLVPARGGVIVACAPDIIFLADHDGDGRAEVRDKLFSGHRLEQPGESRPGATCGSAVARDCRPLALCPARTPRVATSRSRSSGVAREHRCQLGGQSCIVQQQRLVGPQARKAKADAGAFRYRSVRPSHHPAPACRLPHGSTNVYRSSRVRRLWKCHWPDYPLGGGFMPHPLRRWRLTHPPRYADQHPHHAHRRTWKNQ